jgi:hypothetical protein
MSADPDERFWTANEEARYGKSYRAVEFPLRVEPVIHGTGLTWYSTTLPGPGRTLSRGIEHHLRLKMQA